MGMHFIEKKHLSATGMLRKVRAGFEEVPELLRSPKGVKARISLPDCLMSGLAVFGLKFPSLLQFDESYEDEAIKHNLKTLYGVNDAPCVPSKRERLDEVDPRTLRPAFASIFFLLQRGKVLEDYKILGKYLAIACDGTEMFPLMQCIVKIAVKNIIRMERLLTTIKCWERL